MTELNRQPAHAGEILREEFLEPLGMTQSHLAKALHASFRAINELVNEKKRYYDRNGTEAGEVLQYYTATVA